MIGAALRVDASLAPGTYSIPGTLRYQACNDRMCFNPTNAPIQLDVTVVIGQSAAGGGAGGPVRGPDDGRPRRGASRPRRARRRARRFSTICR